MGRLRWLGLGMLVLSLLLSACAPSGRPVPPDVPIVGGGIQPTLLPPVDGGAGGGATGGTRTSLDPTSLESIDLLQMESMPVQYLLQLKGYKSPCEHLEYTIAEPDENGRIVMTVNWVSTAEVCVALAETFEVGINLGSFPAGQLYSVWLNGVKVAEFRP